MVAFKPIDWFIDTAPTPLKLILFLFVLIVFGAIINGLVVGNNYYCYRNELVDNREFSECYTGYLTSFFWKYNLSQQECYKMPEASDPEWNETVCQDFVPTAKKTGVALSVWNFISEGFNRAVDFLSGANRSTTFYQKIYDPGSAFCGELYDCLDKDTAENLGLYPTCSFSKGFNSDDDFPSIENYTYYTRFNKTIESDIDELSIFSIRCTEIGDEEIPEIAVLGFPLFNWRIWVLLMIFGLFIWLVVKLGE